MTAQGHSELKESWSHDVTFGLMEAGYKSEKTLCLEGNQCSVPEGNWPSRTKFTYVNNA